MSLTKRHRKIARKMSQFLRFEGKDFIASDGFADINDLIREISNPNSNITPEDIELIVANCNKQRFTIESSKIRCNQGHGIYVPVPDLETIEITLANIDEAGVCAHGTTQEALTKIKESNKLDRMDRYHIHFAEKMPNDPDLKSGMRDSSEVIILLDVEKCLKDGIPLRKSTNGVILSIGKGDTGAIPSEYFRSIIFV